MHTSRQNGKKSLYREIYDYVYGLVANGEYGPSGRLPTEHQLVRKFRASRSTVAKAMKELECVGIIRRQAGAGSFAMETALSRCTFASLLIAGLGDIEFFTPICAQIALSCQKYNICLIWGNAGPATPIEERANVEPIIANLRSQRVTGVFFAPNQQNDARPDSDNADLRLAQRLQDAGIAVVLIDRDVVQYPHRSRFDFVGVDNLQTAYEQTMHLHACGCRRIICLTRSGSLTTKSARIVGYRLAMDKLELPCSAEMIHVGQPDDPAFVKETLRGKPDGVVCFNDPMATAYLHTLRSLGVAVPRDIKVIGVDDLEYTKFLPVPLTTMRQPRKELGELAVEMLVRRLNNKLVAPSENLLATTLVPRESTVGIAASVETASRPPLEFEAS